MPSYLIFFKTNSISNCLRRNLSLIIFIWQHLSWVSLWRQKKGAMKRKLFSLSSKVVIVYYEKWKQRVKIISFCAALTQPSFQKGCRLKQYIYALLKVYTFGTLVLIEKRLLSTYVQASKASNSLFMRKSSNSYQ